MMVETTTVLCINELYVEHNGKKIKLYDKNKEYKFIRVNKSEWICRDEDILALCTHVISDESLVENFMNREDIRDKNISDLFKK